MHLRFKSGLRRRPWRAQRVNPRLLAQPAHQSREPTRAVPSHLSAAAASFAAVTAFASAHCWRAVSSSSSKRSERPAGSRCGGRGESLLELVDIRLDVVTAARQLPASSKGRVAIASRAQSSSLSRSGCKPLLTNPRLPARRTIQPKSCSAVTTLSMTSSFHRPGFRPCGVTSVVTTSFWVFVRFVLQANALEGVAGPRSVGRRRCLRLPVARSARATGKRSAPGRTQANLTEARAARCLGDPRRPC